LELCQLTRELNAIFETQITMEMMSHLIHFTRIFRYVYIHLRTNDDYISSLISIDLYIWLFLHVTMIFCTNYMCETVSVKVNLYIILKTQEKINVNGHILYKIIYV